MSFGRIAYFILLQALRNEHVQSALIEVSKAAAKRANAYLYKKLKASSKVYND